MACSLLYLACSAFLLSRCLGQSYTPYERLPIDTFQSFGGKFAFPAGGTQSYDEGTPMTIRWTTDFSAVNLYVVYNASVFPPSPGLQRQLSSTCSRQASEPLDASADPLQLATQTQPSSGRSVAPQTVKRHLPSRLRMPMEMRRHCTAKDSGAGDFGFDRPARRRAYNSPPPMAIRLWKSPRPRSPQM